MDIAQRHDAIVWRCRVVLEKFHGDSTDPDDLYEVIESEGNMLMYGGASCLWECLKGSGTATSGQALTYFNNANAALGVGNSATAEAATQNNLLGTRLRKAMESTYPIHTDGLTNGADDITFRSLFGTADANFTWNEWGVFNSATDAVGRMLNRKVQNLGTKTSAATWQLTVNLSLGNQ